MPIKYFFELLLLSALWGASFLFMRTTSEDFGPIVLVALRTSIAGLFLLPFLYFKKQFYDLKIHWRPILFVGITNNAVPFCLFAYSAIYLNAGYASILNATAPMFAALIGFFWLKDRITRIAIFGLFLGFAGVGLLSLARTTHQAESEVLPILAALLATFFYGIAANYIKRYLQGVSTIAVASGSMFFASAILLPLSLFFLPTQLPSAQSWLHVMILSVFCTGFAAILYFHLIANIGTAKAITVAYLVPVFGVVWGMIFLKESLTLGMWIGAIMVLTGVALTIGMKKKRVKNS